MQERLEDRIKHQAALLGFDAVGIVKPGTNESFTAKLDRFLELGRHGTMDWMATRAVQRRHPRALWPALETVIVVGQNYGPDSNPLEVLAAHDRGLISVYAGGDDYHDGIKKRLKTLARWLVSQAGGEVKVFVDTAPVMEKPLAARAGIGWQGKHTNLVSRDWGSWLFLGLIFTTVRLRPDSPARDACGRCRACLDICPTNAFPAPYQLDARRCISYLTIEHKGHIPEAFREPIGNRIYGCDDCLAVCPWNKFAKVASDHKLATRPENDRPALAGLATLDDAGFRARFSKSPVKRIGRDRFVRNVLIAVGNSGDPALVPSAVRRLDDAAPIVRAMAVWAMSRLGEHAAFEAERGRRMPTESDTAVLAEWTAGRERLETREPGS